MSVAEPLAPSYPTHCKRGHWGHWRWNAKGHRICRACVRDATAAHRERLRAAEAASVELAVAVVAIVDPPAVVVGDDGVERYSIAEWHRRFGAPPVAYGQVENDS